MLIFKKFGIIENTTSKNKQTKEIAFPHKKIKRVFCFFLCTRQQCHHLLLFLYDKLVKQWMVFRKI